MKNQTQLVEDHFRDLLVTRQTGGGVREESYYDAPSNLLNGTGKGLTAARPLRAEEIREVTNMARRIAAVLLLEAALDASYSRCEGET